MPETPNQDTSRQRRANWVALRTLRQLPKPVGETADGEPVYEVRSVRLLLHGTAANFVRLAECSRCGRELSGAPVLTPADLDRPLRPMICTDCIRRAGVSTVWESESGERAGEPPPPAPAALAASDPEPAPAPPEVERQQRLDVMEGHLRAVTDRVNELGRVARAQQADFKDRSGREEATAAALRDELAALRASTDDTRAELDRLAGAQAELDRLAGARAELDRLAGAQAELDRRLAESVPAGEAGAGTGQLREEVARLARLVESQRREIVGVGAAVGETQVATGKLAAAQAALAETFAGFNPAKVEGLITSRLAEAEGRMMEAVNRPPAEVDMSKIEELVTTRLAEAEGRLAQAMAGQWGNLETAIEGSVNASMAGVLRANEELAGGQAALAERIDELAGQMTQATTRLQTLLGRLDALEAAFLHAPGPLGEVTPTLSGNDVPARGFIDSLDRQLEAAARRLAARSQAGAGRGDQ